MPQNNIIKKLEKSKLQGRGGANFPVLEKWINVKKAKNKTKYIICNAAESEPNTHKDEYIIKSHTSELINGIRLAQNYLSNSHAIIYLKPNYFNKHKKLLNNHIKSSKITLFKKTGSYLCGEETTLINDIEGKEKEPRHKPPFPTTSGLHNSPTIVNNVETFYYISKISKGQYLNTRFISIAGNANNKGTFELELNLSLNNILKSTNNYPNFNFFIQINGGASGKFLNKNQLNQKLTGVGSIIIYKSTKTNTQKLIKDIINFFNKENCNKCVPCREGIFRLSESIKQNNLDKKLLDNVLFTMDNTSFCALGKSVSTPLKSILKIHENNN